MTDAQLAFIVGPTFRGLWVSNVIGRGRLWTVTWAQAGEFVETDYCESPSAALDAAIANNAGAWVRA